MKFTHEERRQRRANIAQDAVAMVAQNPIHKHVVVQSLCEKYRVGTATVMAALKEHNVTISYPKCDEKIVHVEQSKRIQEILAFLKDSDLTYKQIAEKIGVTKAYIQIVHKQLIADGYDVPLREEVRERLRIRKEEDLLRKDQEFVKLYTETNDFEGSAQQAGISILRATKVRKKFRLNATGLFIDRELCEQYPSLRISRRLLYILADLLYTDLPLSHIADKWKKNKPFIFNLANECRQAGIKLPEHKDGRANARNKPAAKTRTCVSCGKDFRTTVTTEDGTKKRLWRGRVRCVECNPYGATHLSQKAVASNSSNNNDLQESATN